MRDPQFGPCVVLGLGGIFTEALGDVVFAAAPLGTGEALRLIDGLRTQALLGRFRGEPAVDRDALARLLVGLGTPRPVERADVRSVDLNPLIVRDGQPVAVDALVELDAVVRAPAAAPVRARSIPRRCSSASVRSSIRAAWSSPACRAIPGKFGFVAFHNLLRFGYRGAVFPVNREGAEVLGHATLRDVADVPAGAADLAVVCTPAAVNAGLLRACAARGVRAAFVASGGYGESGRDGKTLEDELVRTANECGVLLAGPNGQGLDLDGGSTCAHRSSRPTRRRAASRWRARAATCCSALLNYAVLTGIGVSKAISCGNSAQTTIADYLDYFAADPETAVALAYTEGVGDGRAFLEALRRLAAAKPLVLLKGGVAGEGQRAAASHTGSLATDDRIFSGICRQLGVLRAPGVEQAFEWAATFATQPLPRGRRVVVFTTAGGWGVLTADACAAAGLELLALPEDLRARDRRDAARALEPPEPDRPRGRRDARHDPGRARPGVRPSRRGRRACSSAWASRRTRPTCSAAGASTRATGSTASSSSTSARIAAMPRPRAPPRSSTASRCWWPASWCTRTAPTATPARVAVREGGRLCYPSAHRAVAALRAMVEYVEFRAGRA